MKSICFLVGYSLDLPAIRNRIIPIINKALDNSYKIYIITSGKRKLDIVDKNIEYIFLNISNELPVNFILRGFSEFYYAYKLLKCAYSQKSDFLIITIPNIFNLLFCKKINGNTKQILDVRDLVWEYLDDKYLVQILVKYFFRIIFSSKIKDFDAISCSNMNEYEYIKKISKNRISNLILYSNGINLDQFKDLQKIKNSSLNNKSLKITYVGNLGVAQNLKTLIYASQKFPLIQFNIVGGGKEFKTLLKLSNNAKNIKFYGRQEWQSILKIYSDTNILYAQLSSNFHSAMPSKLYEYLSTGKFIIYGGSGLAPKILDSFENNITIEPDNINKLCETIEMVIKNKYYKKISNGNIEKIQIKYLRDIGVSKLFEYIDIKN